MTIISIISILLALLLVALFVISIFLHLPLIFIVFGPITYLIIRLLFSWSDPVKALVVGFKAAFWPYIATIIINAFFFSTISICFSRNFTSLIIIPLCSAILALFVNYWPIAILKRLLCNIEYK